MSDVATQRVYSWALETRFGGPVDAAAVAAAAGQFRGAGGARVWLLDAGHATAFDAATLPAIEREVGALRALGLDRVAFVVPWHVRALAPALAARMAAAAGVAVVPFDTRADGAAWLRRGCR